MQVTSGYRFLLSYFSVGISDDDLGKSFFQICDVACQTQNCHNLRCYGDVIAVFSRHSVCSSAKAVYNASKLTVIHIYASFPGDLSRIDIQSVSLENVVVDHSCQQVVCCTDCMEVTGEVKVDIFHWNNLCVSAACCSAFYTEDRSKRWLAKCNHCFFTDSGKSVYQTYRSCCFSFSCRCRVDGCNEDQFSILRIGVF